MLGRALQQQTPAPIPKSTSLSQHSRYKADGNVLEPSQFSILSAPRSFENLCSNPLKRTASQAGSRDDLSGKGSVEQSSSMQGRLINTARVGALHENVYFDENDFDDDSKIDLDEEDIQPVKKYQSSNLSFTGHQPNPQPTEPSKTPASSAPASWSSSPPLGQAVSPTNPSIQTSPSTTTIKVVKRRTLPWQVDSSDGQNGNAQSGPPSHFKDIVARQQKERNRIGESFTPLVKTKVDPPYPWNTTASAVKEEHKRLRQGHKMLVKDIQSSKIDGSKAKLKKKESVASVFLSDEQRSVLDLVTEKQKSVFFTGSAGTGKSVLLREIIKAMRDKHKREQDRVAITASTGLAACNVGGVTLHSFAGIGLGKEAAPQLVRKIRKNPKAKNRWLRTKVLIIDEVSMVDGELFDKLEEIARTIRNNGRPFGGIQLVITGDFFQLPPVPDYGRTSTFSFDAASWNTSIEHTIGLTQVFRQKDPVFANMLNEMRLGRLTPTSINAFKALNRPLKFGDDFEATELFPTRIEVDNANTVRMRNLSGTDFEFKAMDGGLILDTTQREKLLSNCMAPQSITLKKGAQVMLIKNIDETLVNGSVGKVVAFMDEKTFDIYHEDEAEFQAVETLDTNIEEMTRSRQKLKQLINKDPNADTSQKWPLVRFAIADGTSRDLLCQREQWNIELPNGEVQASRLQIPLILAWALSIHKAQGQTLERVKVDLGKIFEKGQAYVALSRATCQEGLQISRFDPRKVMAHDRVRKFYDGLYSVNKCLNTNANAL